MTEYNIIAWEKLAELTSLTMTQLLDEIHSIGITPCANTFISWRQTGGVTPENLVKICNHFRFPISYFVRIGGKELEARHYHIVDEAKWQDIELMPSRIVDYVAKVDRYKRENAKKRIGCSSDYYDAMRKYPQTALPQKLTFKTFLTYLNNAKMYPGDVIIDRNMPFPMEYSINPFYNNAAMHAHDLMFPKPKSTFVAEEIIDTKEFLMHYVTSGRVEGDDRIVGISIESLNEISSVISNLRSEVVGLRDKIKRLEQALEKHN